ncbi:unnamed protein product [Mucor hiemalis]
MVCATNTFMNSTNNNSNNTMNGNPHTYREDDDDFDMAMDEDDDSEEDSSQDDDNNCISTPTSSTSSTPTTKQRPATQALFLNFTSDLSPQKMNKKKSKPKKQTAYRVNGVNILNRNNLDSKTAIERIQRRRENHNHVERRRRDNINNTIFELSSVVPNAIQPGQKPNKGNILKLSLDYIKDLQAENNALKERLAHFTSSPSRPTSISPPLSAATTIINTPSSSTTTTTTTTSAVVLKSVDDSMNNNFPQQQSPSAPTSPTRFIPVFNGQKAHSSSASVPSSPLHTLNPIMPHNKENASMNGLPPPLSLPPPRQQAPQQHHHQQQQTQQAHLQTVFSSMSVSSNTSSTNSTPTLSASPYPIYNTNSNPQQIYIPQPPQLFNHHPHEVFQQQQPQQKGQPGLRPLLPATKPQIQQPAIHQQQPSFLPALRMSGYEKIYGNVCRY